MMHRRSIFVLVLCAATALPALAGTARYAITAEQVAAAVADRGMQLSPDQVTFFTSVVSSASAPELKVKSIDRMGAQRAVARIECADSQQCLPFVVALNLNQAQQAELAASSAQQTPRSIAQAKPSPILLHAGAPAVLQLDGMHVHVRLTVICLENGTLGQMIRATDHDRKQIYLAKVTESGVLEGRL
ncbi:MAG TPA: hypothetical protein VFB43_08500 [Terracidiphilus sp.]|nr:hypothetical protein [Terracidiphilus sp.]